MLRALILIPFLLLAACVTSPSYTYYYGDGPDDPRYSDATAVDGDYYYGNTPAYLAYPAYFDVLWPVYSNYYDPFFTPGFYYGVTFFPSYYRRFGAGWSGWGGWNMNLAFSPWRHAYWDHAYDWSYWYRNQQYQQYARYQHFGSARNQQVVRAGMMDQSRRYPGPSGSHRAVRGAGAVAGPRSFARGQDGVPPNLRQRPDQPRAALPSARYYGSHRRDDTAPRQTQRANDRPTAPIRSAAAPTRQALAPAQAAAPALRQAPAPRMAAPAPMSRALAPASAPAMSRPSVGSSRSAGGRQRDR